jgi:hypothetical protein
MKALATSSMKLSNPKALAAVLVIILVGLLFASGLSRRMQWNFWEKDLPEVDSEDVERLLSNEQDYDFSKAICALTRVRNDKNAIAEWIAYHTVLGFSQFYIYDDCSTDGTPDFLRHLISLNHNIKVLAKPHCNPEKTDRVIYNALFEEAKHHCQYIMAFEVNEFVTRQNDLYSHSLAQYLDDNNVAFMKMMWYTMGNDGRIKKPEGLVIESYLHGDYLPTESRTLVTSMFVQEWSLSTRPTRMRRVSNDIASLMVQTRDKPDRDVLFRGKVISAPGSPWFLKRYETKSWDDYTNAGSSSRQDPKGNQPGFLNYEAWQAHNSTSLPLSRVFTAVMVSKTKQELNKYGIKYKQTPLNVGPGRDLADFTGDGN